MTDPTAHYHRIETADELASEKQDDVMYYLTRLEGQLERLSEIIKDENSNASWTGIKYTAITAKAFAQSLRNAIENG